MGGSNWSSASYRTLKDDYATKSTKDIFTSTNVTKDMDPKGVKFRESRDSDVHPLSEAIALFVDDTGSMGQIPEQLIRHKLGVLMETLINHDVKDAHVLFGSINDHYCTRTPLQVGQFEAGTAELNKWLTSIHLQGGGGGQHMESYALAWLFCGRHTSIDCFEKRKEKGFLFTVGDEWTHPVMEAKKLSEIFGHPFQEDVSAEQALREAQRLYNVFHLHCNEGSYRDEPRVIDPWKKLLGERLIIVEDYTTIAEIVASTVAVIHGAALSKVVSGFDDDTARKVTNALVKVSSGVVKQDKGVLKL